MPIRDYMGDTFVAFLDISGFKKYMRKGKAMAALECFYSAGYEILGDQNGNQVDGIFISDCGVLFVRNDQVNLSPEDNLHHLLTIIKRINERMISNRFMVTTSIAYGNFVYLVRDEFLGINKNFLVGNAYLEAFLDNEKGKPKIQPGQCRLLENNLPNGFENIMQRDERFRLLCKRFVNDKHYYYYWMVNNHHEIEGLEEQYEDAYDLKFAGMLDVLRRYQRT